MGPARSLQGRTVFISPRRGRRNRDLPFVRRGGILLQRGIAIVVAFPPPSLGVSSLDLGRLHPRAALFLPMFSPCADPGAPGGPKLGLGPQAPADRPCANRDAAMR